MPNPHHPPIYHDTHPAHLMTAAQLAAAGLPTEKTNRPVALLARTLDGDTWHTGLYDTRTARPTGQTHTPPRPMERSAGQPSMAIVCWTRPVREPIGGRYIDAGERSSKAHVSIDGSHTVCGFQIPHNATVITQTIDWHQHTNCYNCSYRLWPDHAPPGYLRPINGQDFPMRRAHPPGRDSSSLS